MTRAPRRCVAVMAVLLVLLPGGAAQAQDGPVVLDVLADRLPPTAAEIAATIRPLDAPIVPIEVPAPRPLREQAQEGSRTTLTIATDVLFAFDSTELTSHAERILRGFADEIAGAAGTVLVVGHTDSIGTDAYNQDLSERRAEAVAAVLADALGGGVAIATEGRGEDEPVADEGDGDPAAAARNRRVEIVYEG